MSQPDKKTATPLSLHAALQSNCPVLALRDLNAPSLADGLERFLADDRIRRAASEGSDASGKAR